jgi:MFS family permease
MKILGRLKRKLIPHWTSQDWASLWVLFFLGFVGGVILRASDTLLRNWGNDLGFEVKDFDILAAIGLLYSGSFFWAPVFNKAFSVFMEKIGIRVFWLTSLTVCTGIICWAASFCQMFSPLFLLLAAFFVLLRASLDTLIIASQADTAAPYLSFRGITENFCVNGYLTGMMVSLSGSFFLSAKGISWPTIYRILGTFFLISSILMTRLSFFRSLKRPQVQLNQTWEGLFVMPLKDIFLRPDGWWVILLMFLFCMQDGIFIPNKELFYLGIGLSKTTYAALDVYNLGASILGGIVGSLSMGRLGYKNTLSLGVLTHTSSLLGLWYQARYGLDSGIFLWCILERASIFFCLICFYSMQIVYCHPRYVLTQLAWMSAFVNFGMQAASTVSGNLVHILGWPGWILSVLWLGLPPYLVALGIFHFFPRAFERRSSDISKKCGGSLLKNE